MPRYFWLYIWSFWVPILILLPILWRYMDAPTKKSLFISLVCISWPLSIVMEYVYLKLDVWDFSEAWDPLLGIKLFGAPIEEFVFWFGAPVIILLVYTGLDLLDRKFLRKRAAP
jgi:lycopene cyclase domain-containing protein